MAETAHVTLQIKGRGRKAKSGVIHLRDALIVACLCVIAAVLIAAATAYLALNKIWPALAPVRVHERLRVWSRFSLLTIQEIRSWR
ncbi:MULTISPECIES: hypothetical protein [unclassified Methylobacterium]|uniref:hypothetical protein n=1 Tax=unclassified Methylobacterium TaxID=2615210 RepID=UPI001FBBE7E6|nr:MULTISPECIES: hypothetical protein [unclassified Methylobacterium]MCJ2022535.1 hypothetical protein [Methylobacterium sp. E-065]